MKIDNVLANNVRLRIEQHIETIRAIDTQLHQMKAQVRLRSARREWALTATLLALGAARLVVLERVGDDALGWTEYL